MSAKGNASTTGLLAWLPDRERAELEELLRPGEDVLFATAGRIIRSGIVALRSWTILVTSARLLCVRGTGLLSRRVIEIPATDITSVDVFQRALQTEVRITATAGTLRFGGVTRLMAAQLAAAVSEVCARDDHAQPSGRPAHELQEELAVLKQAVVRLEASLGTIENPRTP